MGNSINQILLFSLVMLFSWQGKAVICKEMAHGKWAMQTDQGVLIGPSDLGSPIEGSPITGLYGTEAHCKQVIQESLNGDLVCSWNRKSYQIYNAQTGLGLGSASPEKHFSLSASCGRSTKSQSAGTFVCGWTPKNRFAPFVRKTNLQIGSTQNGWEYLEGCVKGALNKARSELICSWDGERPGLYDSDGNKLIEFIKQKECDNFIDSLPRDPDQLKQVIQKIVTKKLNAVELNEGEKSLQTSDEIHLVSGDSKPFCLALDKGLERGCARNAEMDSQCVSGHKAFHQLSCMTDESLSNLVPEILKLSPGDVIPPWVYQVYHPNQIAQSLIYQFHRKIEQPKQSQSDNENPNFDFFKNTSLQMAVNLENIEKIAKNGFKNQHETRTSNGYLNRDYRLEVENKLTGFKIEAFESQQTYPQQVKPKYTFLVPLVSHPNILEHRYATGYGNIIMVFKDYLKTRATWTNGDSLTYNEDRRRMVHSFSYATENPNIIKLGKYYEAQIWGTIGLSDVSYILVNCKGLNAINGDSIERINNLLPGVPVFSCKMIDEPGVTAYVPEKYLKENFEALENQSVINLISSVSNDDQVDKKIHELCDRKVFCRFNIGQLNEKGKTPPKNISMEYTCRGRKESAPQKISLIDLRPEVNVDLKCVPKPEAFAEIPTVIKITEATYGASGEVSFGNVTSPVAKYCDNKKACNYKVHPMFIGDPSPGKQKSISIQWSCIADGVTPTEKKVELPTTAVGTILKLTCPSAKFNSL